MQSDLDGGGALAVHPSDEWDSGVIRGGRFVVTVRVEQFGDSTWYVSTAVKHCVE
ncbi:MAG: hypothetical protein ACR2ME_06820 [Acidimicrobiia bacterium]